jgi:hypothetical protein
MADVRLARPERLDSILVETFLPHDSADSSFSVPVILLIRLGILRRQVFRGFGPGKRWFSTRGKG